jgi:hypothetical protein
MRTLYLCENTRYEHLRHFFLLIPIMHYVILILACVIPVAYSWEYSTDCRCGARILASPSQCVRCSAHEPGYRLPCCDGSMGPDTPCFLGISASECNVSPKPGTEAIFPADTDSHAGVLIAILLVIASVWGGCAICTLSHLYLLRKCGCINRLIISDT